jgi:hypothetical protein
MKGTDMRFRIFALLLLSAILAGRARAEDKLYLYVECAQGQNCINLGYDNGKMESVTATPAQVLGKADIKSASVQQGGNGPQSLSIKLNQEAAGKLEAITRENIGKRIFLVLNNKILMAPTVRTPITFGEIMTSTGYGENDRFWEKVPWLQDLIKESYGASHRSIMIYAIIASLASMSALIFIVLPRLRHANMDR